MNQNRLNAIKEKYPKGTRIELDHMDDPYNPVPEGMTGTVYHVDDMGDIHVKWDNGSGLALIPGEDQFHIIEQKQIFEQSM